MSDEGPSSGFSIDWNKAARRLTLLIGAGVLLNLLLTYVLSGNFQWRTFAAFKPAYLIAALLLSIYPWLAHAWEIQIWSRFFGNPMQLKDALGVSVATDLGAAITPTMVGGAPIKAGLLMRRGLNAGQAGAMVLFTGLEDILFFLMIIPVSIYLSDRIGLDVVQRLMRDTGVGAAESVLIFGGIALVIAAVYFLLKRFNITKRIAGFVKRSLTEFRSALSMIATNGKSYFLLATAAIVSRWISRFLILVCLVLGLGIQTDYLEVFMSEWLVYMGMTVTPTPGAIGGAEGVFFAVYRNLIPLAEIGVIITMWRFFNYYLILALSAIYVNIWVRS